MLKEFCDNQDTSAVIGELSKFLPNVAPADLEIEDIKSSLWSKLQQRTALDAASASDYETLTDATTTRVPTALLVQPNRFAKVCVVNDEGSALSGQFQTVARQRIWKGTLIPVVGQVVHDTSGAGRTDYEIHLRKKVSRQDTILLVDLRRLDASGCDTSLRELCGLNHEERAKHQNASYSWRVLNNRC